MLSPKQNHLMGSEEMGVCAEATFQAPDCARRPHISFLNKFR